MVQHSRNTSRLGSSGILAILFTGMIAILMSSFDASGENPPASQPTLEPPHVSALDAAFLVRSVRRSLVAQLRDDGALRPAVCA